MDIFCGVDGTGADSNTEYEIDFKKSFVNRIHRNWHGQYKYYDRGPSLWGTETEGKAQKMAKYAESAFRVAELKKKNEPNPLFKNGDTRIFLAGYSRGGAAAIEAAKILTKRKIPVYALLLFDAVNRSQMNAFGNFDVPDGVFHCRHAIRSPDAKSRPYFGHVGLRGASSVEYPTPVPFFCTHGAMGGTPFKSAHTDKYIYEQEGGVPSPNSMSPYLSPQYAVLKLGFDIAIDKGSKTNVRLKEEEDGTALVESYMFNELRTLIYGQLYYEPTIKPSVNV